MHLLKSMLMKLCKKPKNLMIKEKQAATPANFMVLSLALKDVICYKDHPLSASSNILKRILLPFILLQLLKNYWQKKLLSSAI